MHVSRCLQAVAKDLVRRFGQVFKEIFSPLPGKLGNVLWIQLTVSLERHSGLYPASLPVISPMELEYCKVQLFRRYPGEDPGDNRVQQSGAVQDIDSYYG